MLKFEPILNILDYLIHHPTKEEMFNIIDHQSTLLVVKFTLILFRDKIRGEYA